MSYQDPASVWEAHMAPGVHWKEAYAYLGERTRTYLMTLPANKNVGTTNLATALYDGTDHFTQQRIFSGLKALAAHQLADCWSPGQPIISRIYGRDVMRTPKAWHAPKDKTCPHCGGKL